MADTESPATDAAAAATVDVAAPALDAILRPMHNSAQVLSVLLTAICLVCFIAGRAILEHTFDAHFLLGVALVGMSGSGLGALTSLLARYAAGFELEDGTRIPAGAEGEVYHRRIAFCMLMRPVLGALVAPLLVVGVVLFFKQHEEFKGSADAVTVVAFIGGLYAKSAIDAAKTAFKVVFRA